MTDTPFDWDRAVAKLRRRIIDAGCDGALSPDEGCGCELDDLAPCMSDDLDECQPGYKATCIGPACAHQCDVGTSESYALDFCICKDQDGPTRRKSHE